MLQFATVHCPYCGEPIELTLDPYSAGQVYVEDCQVCCRPIEVSVSADASGTLAAVVGRDD